ncbi:MAG: hypothetical protein KME35_11890 [Aphanocapsa sp. GSE-SYN-MK-11-07L]|nr:hypothetical protein [Aphanocapsa sp. GSE-SYN-MK-11-07L]
MCHPQSTRRNRHPRSRRLHQRPPPHLLPSRTPKPDLSDRMDSEFSLMREAHDVTPKSSVASTAIAAAKTTPND